MSDELKISALNIFNKAKKAATELADKTIIELEKSGTLDELKTKQEEVKKYLDKKGITEKAEFALNKGKEYSDMAGDHLDQVSGKKILEAVEQRLELQTEYNDLLATKLEEALQRIEALENDLREKK